MTGLRCGHHLAPLACYLLLALCYCALLRTPSHRFLGSSARHQKGRQSLRRCSHYQKAMRGYRHHRYLLLPGCLDHCLPPAGCHHPLVLSMTVERGLNHLAECLFAA